MMEGSPRDIRLKSYLNKAIDKKQLNETMSNEVPDRVRTALENVPEWVNIPEMDKDECVAFVSSKIPNTYPNP